MWHVRSLASFLLLALPLVRHNGSDCPCDTHRRGALLVRLEWHSPSAICPPSPAECHYVQSESNEEGAKESERVRKRRGREDASNAARRQFNTSLKLLLSLAETQEEDTFSRVRHWIFSLLHRTLLDPYTSSFRLVRLIQSYASLPLWYCHHIQCSVVGRWGWQRRQNEAVPGHTVCYLRHTHILYIDAGVNKGRSAYHKTLCLATGYCLCEG